MRISYEELIERACNWWRNLDDGELSEIMEEAYMEQHGIRKIDDDNYEIKEE